MNRSAAHAAGVGALLCAALAAAPAAASDLSYTFVELGALRVQSDLTGTQSPSLTQTVGVAVDSGDGLTVSGSLAVGRRFYISGTYQSAVVDVDALVTSPLEIASLTGNFDFIRTRVAAGYVVPIGRTVDIFFEAAYNAVHYDFGSFAGENFDLDDSGAGVRAGVRFNPNPSLEVFAAGESSAIEKTNLTALTTDSGTAASVGMRWYFFRDLGVGVEYRSGDIDSLAITMRFGFGGLRAGRD